MVGKLYEDIDVDYGNTIFYSSTRGPPLAVVKKNGGTRALMKSMQTGKPVRVLRARGSKWRGAPREGIRFDGLYKVTSSKDVEVDVGAVYCQFELVRLVEQEPIDCTKPTAEHVREYKMIAEGY